MRISLVMCSLAVLTAGCALFDRQERRIDYTERLDEGAPSLVTDAKQRAIINTKADVGVGDVKIKADGTRSEATDDLVVKNHPKRIICAEPSPDVAQAISAAFTAAGQVDAKLSEVKQISGSGSVGSSYAASIAQLGERLATVQLLRDKMYRACEAYQNGAISDTSYTLMLARFDKTMASMLASETAAGAFGRNLAALGGSASTSAVDPKKLADARDAVKDAAKELEAAAALPEADDPAKEKKKTAVANASAKLNDAVSKLAELEFQNAATYAQSGPVGAGGTLGQIIGRGAIDADAVAQIHANFLDDDASGTIIDACVVALDRNRAGGVSSPVIDQLKADAKAEIEAERAKKVLGLDATGAPIESEALRTAKKKLQDLESLTRPSLASICAAMLNGGDLANNFLLKLQQNKQEIRKIETELVTEQIKSEIAQAQAKAEDAKSKAKESELKTADTKKQVTGLVDVACTSQTKAVTDPLQHSQQYNTCVEQYSKIN